MHSLLHCLYLESDQLNKVESTWVEPNHTGDLVDLISPCKCLMVLVTLLISIFYCVFSVVLGGKFTYLMFPFHRLPHLLPYSPFFILDNVHKISISLTDDPLGSRQILGCIGFFFFFLSKNAPIVKW